MVTTVRSIAPHVLRLPPRVRFGRGASVAAAGEIAVMGPTLALVHGASATRAAPLSAALAEHGAAPVVVVRCPTEPTLAMLTEALSMLRSARVTGVVAVGGGAALDLGKALAALAPAPGADPLDHLEVVGAGRPLEAAPLPFVAVPTTAGTGSEATKNAVITVPDHARKVSLRDDRMVAELVIIDPALTDGTPAAQTLASGLDAVTQLIEPFLSARATPVTDALCRAEIGPALSALAQLVTRGEDPGARDALAHAAFVSGIALANAGLGAVHGLAGVLGGQTGAAHGAICGRLLPHVLTALAETVDGDAQTAVRLTEIEGLFQDTLGVGRDGLADWIAGHGLGPTAAPLTPALRAEIAAQSASASSMKASPVRFELDRLTEILRDAGW